MSVWFKYPSDKDITTGHPSGSSVFAPVSGGGGFPPYGTVLYTDYTVTYQNGTEQYSSITGNFVKTQNCDVQVLADGVGGSFYDWGNATNIQYKPYGEVVASDGASWETNPVEIPSGSYNFINSGYYASGKNEIHDGMGNLIFEGIGTFAHYSAGSFTGASNPVANTTECPPSSSNYVDNGTGYEYPYLWDGTGGYYESVTGNFYGSHYSNGTEVDSSFRYNNANLQSEVPDPSGYFVDNGKYEIYTYYWDGYGGVSSGYFGIGGSFYNWGDYIYNDGTYDYYWDGYGGYYTV